MDIVVASLAFAIAALCAGTMGFAIQRGATCTVAAVDEVVNARRFHRLAALVEASAWFGGGLAIAQALHLLGGMPSGCPVSYGTLLGGSSLMLDGRGKVRCKKVTSSTTNGRCRRPA